MLTRVADFQQALKPNISTLNVRQILKEREKILPFSRNLLVDTPFYPAEYAPTLGVFASSTDEKKVLAEFIMRQVLPEIRSRQSMLDVGFHDGKLTRWIAPSFERVTAVEMCTAPEQQKSNRLLSGKNGITVINKPLENSGIENGSFDFVLASHVLNFCSLEYAMKLAKSIAAKASPGGTVLFAMNGRGDPHSMIKALSASKEDTYATAKCLIGMLAGCQVEMFKMRYNVIAENDLHMMTIAAFYLYDTPVNKGTNEVAEYVKRFRKGDGKYEMHGEQIALVVRK